jgi:putative salt-induced outer membrane protein YdiY
VRIGGSGLCLAAITMAMLVGSTFADTVRLHSGDTLIGRVEAADEQTVRLIHPVLGAIDLPAASVASIERGEPGEDAIADAPVATAAEDESPAAEAAAEALAPPAPIAPATPAPADTPERGLFGTALFIGWDHSISVGVSGSAGNTDNQTVNARWRSSFEDDDDRWRFDASYFLASSGSNRTRNEANVTLTRDWLIPDSRRFYFLNAGYQYDQFKAWEHRASGFGGVGYTLVSRPTFEFNTRLGVGATYEWGAVNELTPEALFGATVVRWNITDSQTLAASNTFFPNLRDLGEFRNVSALEYQIKIDRADGISLRFGIENEYESDPEPGDKSYNLKYYGALVIDF